eukprot:432953_1
MQGLVLDLEDLDENKYQKLQQKIKENVVEANFYQQAYMGDGVTVNYCYPITELETEELKEVINFRASRMQVVSETKMKKLVNDLLGEFSISTNELRQRIVSTLFVGIERIF